MDGTIFRHCPSAIGTRHDIEQPNWNRDRVGWAHIGFEHRMLWTPPFGYYDGEVAK